MNQIKVSSKSRDEIIDITADVEKILGAEENHPADEASAPLLRKEGSPRDGICVIFTQHTTCGVTVNENADPHVQSDMLGWLRRLVPQFPTTPEFKHGEQNSDAHIKSSLVGCSVTVPFENGKLLLGRWQGIYLCEFDGPRERKVLIQIMNAK